MAKFLHSGKYGDLIYSLWTIKALGGGELLFNLTNGSLCNEEGFLFCKPLMERQSYITKVEKIIFNSNLENNRGEKLFCRQDINNPDLLILDNAWYWRIYPETHHWIHRYAYTFGVKVNPNDQVLHVQITQKKWEERPIILNLTSTFRTKDDSFYNSLIQRSDVIKVGNRPECGEKVYDNMYDLAYEIANSKFFIGNQSCCNAIAQGLQHPRIIEMEYQYGDTYPIGEYGFILSDNLDKDLEMMIEKSKMYWSNI